MLPVGDVGLDDSPVVGQDVGHRLGHLRGAGRKKRLVRSNVRHRVRPGHPWYHPVHVTLRRAKGLPGLRSELLYNELREAVRLTRRDDFRIVQYSVQRDHVHMLIGIRPHLSVSRAVQFLKGKSSHRLLSEYQSLRKRYWGQHLWARGFWVATSGNVTDEVWKRYIEEQKPPEPDDDFNVV